MATGTSGGIGRALALRLLAAGYDVFGCNRRETPIEHPNFHIDAYWGSRKRWESLAEKMSEMQHFTDWNTVVPIDHGYDETKPESELTLGDMRKAAAFRGGKLLSTAMKTGDWQTKLEFECAFGHSFQAGPRLVLEGGRWLVR